MSASYTDLIQLYMQYVHNHFSNVLVVFDGYVNGPSTKDEIHQRRVCNEMGVDVDFSSDMIMKVKRKPFLANQRNKQRSINILGAELEKESGCQVTHSSRDADFDIVKTACNIASSKPVIVVGDNTDLLVLLRHHYS